jgi:hypothetical protein
MLTGITILLQTGWFTHIIERNLPYNARLIANRLERLFTVSECRSA